MARYRRSVRRIAVSMSPHAGARHRCQSTPANQRQQVAVTVNRPPSSTMAWISSGAMSLPCTTLKFFPTTPSRAKPREGVGNHRGGVR
jgi:hypothetical protein